MTEKKDEDIFEKAFGEEPDSGYTFTNIEISTWARCVHIQWFAQGIGFGGVDLILENKKIRIDSECMSKEFCDSLIDAAVKKLEDEEKKEKKNSKETNYGYDNPKIFSGFLRSLYENVSWDS